MSHPDRPSYSYDHPSNLTDTSRRVPGRTRPAPVDQSWLAEASSHVSLDQLTQRLADVLSGVATPRPAAEPIPSDDALARIIADRPLWSGRRPTDKRSPLDFFHDHYPDAEALYLTWNALRMNDAKLCQALRTHKSRNKSDRIPLLTRTEASVLRFEAKRRAGQSVPLDEAERMARLLKRKDRKLIPSRA